MTIEELEKTTNIPEYELAPSEFQDGKIWICRLMNLAGMADSNSAARRLIQGGGVRIDGEKVQDPGLKLTVTEPCVLQVSKKKFVRVRRA